MKASEMVIDMVAGPDGQWAPSGKTSSMPPGVKKRMAKPVVARSPSEHPPASGSGEDTETEDRHAAPRRASRATAAGARSAPESVPCSICKKREATHNVQGRTLGINVLTCAVCAPIAQVGGGFLESIFGGGR